MSLFPRSYARAAGLQSEINKVTVTRVAGNEVQFRRTIDTYQRDLRFSVSQIGREQRLLRRSMKKYSKKLRDGKKERKQRLAKVKEDSERLKKNAIQFQEAEEAVKRDVLIVRKPEKASPLEEGSSENQHDSVSDQSSGNAQQHNSEFPDSPDSGIDSEMDEAILLSKDTSQTDDPAAKTKSRPFQKAFLTSGKGKPPYFKTKRGQGNSKQDDKRSQKVEQNEDYTAEETLSGDGEELLPVIDEENEDVVDQGKATAKSAEAEPVVPAQADSCPANPDEGVTKTLPTRSIAIPVTALDTKSLGHAERLDTGKDTSETKATHSRPDQKDDSIETEITWKGRRSRRKTGVSYADLIKLQHTHTSSSKQLFKLVDRLASVHGIVDPPPVTSSSRASSLDPRTNVKIKQRGDGPESQMSDGIVKQAAVLYPMKYGYHFPVGESQDGADPDFHSLKISEDVAEENGKEEGVRHHHARKRSVGSVSDAMSQSGKQSTLTVRRDSTDVTSPFYEFSEAASSIFDDLVFEGVSQPHHVQEHQASRTRTKPVTLTQLSEQATKVRQRTLQVPEPPQHRTHDTGSRKIQHTTQEVNSEVKLGETTTDVQSRQKPPQLLLSPVPHRSRSLSRRRRTSSVQHQLQRRLTGERQAGNTAWQSAFGRLKMIHTLFDLAPYFSRGSK